MLALAFAGLPLPLHAGEQSPCATLQTLVDVTRDLETFGTGEEAATFDPDALRKRLDGIDRMALADLRAEQGGGLLGKLVFFLHEILETEEAKGPFSARAILEDKEFQEASRALFDLASSLACRRDRVATVAKAPAEAASYSVDFSYVFDHWRTTLGTVLACLGLAAGVTWRYSRRSERLERSFTCNVTVHVVSEKETLLGTLIEISRQGGKVRFPHPPQTGTKLRIQWDAVWHEAVVTWSNQYCSGLRFTKLIQPDTIQVIRDLSGASVELSGPERAAAPSSEHAQHPHSPGSRQETRQDASL
jgi:PilZ domain